MSHKHGSQSKIGLAAVLNLIFAISEYIAGFAFNSTALLSDAVHDSGDVLSLFLSALMEKLSRKEPTRTYTYGFGRLNLLTAILNSVILLAGMLFIISEAVGKLFNPEPVSSLGMFAMSILGIGVNLWAVRGLKGSKNILDRSVFLHLMEDLLGWIAVFVTSILIYLTGWYILDPIVSLGIALYVLVNVFGNLHQSYRMVMMSTSNLDELAELTANLTQLEGVIGLTDVHYWTIDGERQIFTAKVRIEKSAEPVSLRQAIDGLLVPYHVACSTIEFLTETPPAPNHGEEAGASI